MSWCVRTHAIILFVFFTSASQVGEPKTISHLCKQLDYILFYSVLFLMSTEGLDVIILLVLTSHVEFCIWGAGGWTFCCTGL